MSTASELELLGTLLGEHVAFRLARAVGGWRTLSRSELVQLDLSEASQNAVLALQGLTRHGYPSLTPGKLTCSEAVGRVYEERLGGAVEEKVLVVAMDGQHRVLEEIEVASGGGHGAALTPADMFRPLIRAGATAFILVHNHPSGDSAPSREDVAMTGAVQEIASVVGISFLDHVVVGGRGGGWSSMADLGLLPSEEGPGHASAP